MKQQGDAGLPASTGGGKLSVRVLAAMLALAVIWGVSIPVMKYGLESIPPFTLTALRFAVAVPFLLLFVIRGPRLPRAAIVQVIALGVVGVGFGQIAQTLGVSGTSASAATVISATIPVFVVVIAAFRLKQPVSRLQASGLVAAFIGIGLVAVDGDGGLSMQSGLMGPVFLLLSSVAIAFYYVWSFELTARYGSVPVAAWSTLAGLVALTPWSVWESGVHPVSITTGAVLAILYLGVFVSAVGLFLWIGILGVAPARTAAAVQYLQPVIGIAVSSLVFGDPMGVFFLAGVLFVLVGLVLTMTENRAPAVD